MASSSQEQEVASVLKSRGSPSPLLFITFFHNEKF